MMVGRGRRRLVSRFGSLVVAAALVGLLAGCDTTPVVVSGSVTADPSGSGVGGVVVQVYADDAETLVAQTTSDVWGNWRVQESTLDDGAYRILVGDRWWPDAATWAEADSVALSSGAPTVLGTSFAEIGDVDGGVVDDGGTAFANVYVLVTRASDGRPVGLTQTDESGQFTVPVIAADTYRILLVDPSATWPLIWVGGGTPTDVSVTSGPAAVGDIDISTGLPFFLPSGTTRVSVASGGTQATSRSYTPSLSASGRYVAFYSLASNLVPADTNGVYDVFVHDRSTGATSRVSVASDGTQGDAASTDGAISADGRYVTFVSSASNLVAGDTNGTDDVFVHDRTTGTTTRVSVATDGTQANNPSQQPAISTDGHYVTYISGATNLVAGDTNNANDVFVHDRTTGTTTRVSVATDGTQANSVSQLPAISADGRFVTFSSGAWNLVPDDTNGWVDVFVHDRSTGATSRVSVASNGAEGTDGPGNSPAISTDGRYVTFVSGATNLVAGDTNGVTDAFVHDRTTGTTTRVSVASDGTPANNHSVEPVINADGRYVAFYSAASNLVTGDTNNQNDIFVHDRGAP